MRPVLITLTAGAGVLLLSGCPDLPSGPVPAHSDMHWSSSHSRHTRTDTGIRGAEDSASHEEMHHSVGEIAWFQGTLDEAFSGRGCSESHPRRTLFRF